VIVSYDHSGRVSPLQGVQPNNPHS